MTLKRIALGFGIVFLTAVFIFFGWVPGMVDKKYNRHIPVSVESIPDSIRAFHNSLIIADMHNDVLLWGRDILKKNSVGHTDIPRLIDANVALQVFSVVTKTPRDINYTQNNGNSDNITPLMIAQMAPPSTWFSLTQRALYRARQLEDYSRKSHGRLIVIKNRSDLKQFLQKRQKDRHKIAGVLAIEGMHALDGKLENLKKLDAAGYRMIGLAHFFDNAFSGSAHGVKKYGLTELGRRAVKAMEQRHILVDLAHASPRAIDDVLKIATRPVLVSHTGVQAVCKSVRNLSDAQLRGIAASGGIIGIGYWHGAVCGTDIMHIVKSIQHAVQVAGIDHVGLGSDWDGATRVQIDAAHLDRLTAGLLQAGFNKKAIAKIMGGNFIGLLLRTLP